MDFTAITELMHRAGADAGSRDLHTWGTPLAALEAELRGLHSPVAVVEPGGQGALVLDVAREQRRAWAWGPAVEGEDRLGRADGLLDDALRQLPPEIARISAFPNAGSWLEAWWRRRGASPAGLVHIYRASPSSLRAPAEHIRPAAAEDVAAISQLHDAAFPATYLTATELFDEGSAARRLLVADADGPAGYVCAEVQLDGRGYIHYLAVDPPRRRLGLGRELLLAALHWLHAERAVEETFLTVADQNDARRLYEQAGFSHLATGQTIDYWVPSNTDVV